MEIIAVSFKDGINDKINDRILFQNDACVVINKLPGESSENPDKNNGELGNSECNAGDSKQNKENLILFPVHRLDAPVSGCLLLAKSKEAAAFLGAAFAKPALNEQHPVVEKKYWAIVEKPKDNNILIGNILNNKAELIHWLYENKKINKSFAHPFNDASSSSCEIYPKGKNDDGYVLQKKYGKPKKAVMRYQVIGEGERYIFLEINLVTGRHHQIRAQLAAIGLHIKGDLKYGARRSEKGGGIRLHARLLSFPNPLAPSKIIRVEASPPAEDSLWRSFAEMDRNLGSL